MAKGPTAKEIRQQKELAQQIDRLSAELPDRHVRIELAILKRLPASLRNNLDQWLSGTRPYPKILYEYSGADFAEDAVAYTPQAAWEELSRLAQFIGKPKVHVKAINLIKRWTVETYALADEWMDVAYREVADANRENRHCVLPHMPPEIMDVYEYVPSDGDTVPTQFRRSILTELATARAEPGQLLAEAVKGKQGENRLDSLLSVMEALCQQNIQIATDMQAWINRFRIGEESPQCQCQPLLRVPDLSTAIARLLLANGVVTVEALRRKFDAEGLHWIKMRYTTYEAIVNAGLLPKLTFKEFSALRRKPRKKAAAKKPW